MTCHELADLVTAYLDGALPPEERDRLEAHLQECPGCQSHVSAVRLTVSSLRQLLPAHEDLSTEQGQQVLDVFRTRGLHRRAPRDRDIPLGLGSQLAAVGDHIAYFWESEREFEATAGFLAAGVSLGEGCVLIGHDAANRRLLASLERLGLSVRALMQEHQIQVASVRASADGLLLEVDERIKDAVDRGMPTVRVLGNLNWGRGTAGWPSDREILRLEAHVTSAVERLPSIVVCAYDVTNLPGPMLFKGGVECHPRTFRRDCLLHNELHVPPERFLAELSAGGSG
ncbi:MAG TPA: MEDS domain-containing protein [Methylomirabilota bacterium]|nr:MEDS domain-containing protein [Methylomirabilota bacterium]